MQEQHHVVQVLVGLRRQTRACAQPLAGQTWSPQRGGPWPSLCRSQGLAQQSQPLHPSSHHQCQCCCHCAGLQVGVRGCWRQSSREQHFVVTLELALHLHVRLLPLVAVAFHVAPRSAARSRVPKEVTFILRLSGLRGGIRQTEQEGLTSRGSAFTGYCKTFLSSFRRVLSPPAAYTCDAHLIHLLHCRLGTSLDMK